jgi:hypothetical protein
MHYFYYFYHFIQERSDLFLCDIFCSMLTMKLYPSVYRQSLREQVHVEVEEKSTWE